MTTILIVTYCVVGVLYILLMGYYYASKTEHEKYAIAGYVLTAFVWPLVLVLYALPILLFNLGMLIYRKTVNKRTP